jgi:hypothetical protein
VTFVSCKGAKENGGAKNKPEFTQRMLAPLPSLRLGVKPIPIHVEREENNHHD